MKTHEIDSLTRRKISLFNPRKQNWKRHFQVENGIKIVGKTACGRATVIALKINSRLAITVRQNWLIAGWYPPKD